MSSQRYKTALGDRNLYCMWERLVKLRDLESSTEETTISCYWWIFCVKESPAPNYGNATFMRNSTDFVNAIQGTE